MNYIPVMSFLRALLFNNIFTTVQQLRIDMTGATLNKVICDSAFKKLKFNQKSHSNQIKNDETSVTEEKTSAATIASTSVQLLLQQRIHPWGRFRNPFLAGDASGNPSLGIFGCIRKSTPGEVT